jgi:hypothetical protein
MKALPRSVPRLAFFSSGKSCEMRVILEGFAAKDGIFNDLAISTPPPFISRPRACGRQAVYWASHLITLTPPTPCCLLGRWACPHALPLPAHPTSCAVLALWHGLHSP